MGSVTENYALSEDQKAHFLEHGYVKIPKCFTREESTKFTSNMWTRLGMSPTDKSTWVTERTNMPRLNEVPVSDFAPRAWCAICELIGGEDRISDRWKTWSDSFIVNLGTEEYHADDELDLRGLDNWHTDGDFFIHFLDSPEQALLVIPLFSDIKSKGGGTAICTDGIGLVAKHLYENPDGLTPWMQPRDFPEPSVEERRNFWLNLARNPTLTRDESFHEIVGEVGDVILMHPFMLHSASRNHLRTPRVITNPPVSLKAPFNLNREDPRDYSLVEQKTLKELGRPEGLGGWKATAARAEFVPRRVKVQEEMKRKELERLAALQHVPA